MNDNEYFNAGDSQEFVLKVDKCRQAVHAMGGYAYQCLAAALAWIDIAKKGKLYLEVAEDYAIVVNDALQVTQVKNTKKSGKVTLNSAGVRNAIGAFVELVEKNPGINIDFHFMTTSKIGKEQTHSDRPAGKAGLIYWKEVAAGAEVRPLRAILEGGKFGEAVTEYCKAREDSDLLESLVKKIHWNCGEQDFATLREELESRFVVIGRDRFDLPAEEARRLVNHLVCRVLETSISDDEKKRFLTRADFYELVDAETRVSILRTNLDALLSQLASKAKHSYGEQENFGEAGSVGHTELFINGNTLPVLRQMISRPYVEHSVAFAIKEHRICVLAGGSGVGKTVVARHIADQRSGNYFIVNNRNMKTVETRARLNSVFAHLGELSTSTLILEDLNHLDDQNISLVLGRIVDSVRRRGHELLVTCHRKPSLSTLTAIGLDQTCVVNCRNFTENEVRELVDAYGGNPDTWGDIAYVVGHSGHPQLTHAFVVGVSERGWPFEEYTDGISGELSSEDTNAVLSSVRRSLRNDLSEAPRDLLYRLSLMNGHFKKSLALSIADISPAIHRPGECMDQLVGPWIEASGNDRYQISPLAIGIGREMFSSKEQKRIHRKIAEECFNQGKIDVFDINTITIHALKAKWELGLAKIANMILSMDSRTRGRLAEHVVLIHFFGTDCPIYPNDSFISAILRLAQYSLAANTEEKSDVSHIVEALFQEIDSLPPSESKNILEALAVLNVIATLGIANYIDNWVSILIRSIPLVEQNEVVRGICVETEGSYAEDNSKFFGQIFCIGSANLTSVERLENIIDQLDLIDVHRRNLLLTPIDEDSSDYSIFVNAPWAVEGDRESFDAVDAELRYARMAEKTLSWGIRALTVQCWIARSILLNEYLNDKENALSVLAEAVELLDQDQLLEKARAAVHWYQGEYKTALKIYHKIAEDIKEDNLVERSFALRKAAISAAECDEWLLAEKWFLDAQQAAACLDSNKMAAMAIGLGADAASAALRGGDAGRALDSFAKSVDALANLETDESLAAAYCHRVTRLAIRWVYSRIVGTLEGVDGRTIKLEPGTCSNPDPLPAIREHPLTHIDFTWYWLAEAEISADVDVGINSSLSKRLTEGVIPQMELTLQLKLVQIDIISLNSGGFAEHFTKYIETIVHCSKNMQRLETTFDAVAPKREIIPTLDYYNSSEPMVEQVATEAVLGYGIHTIMVGQSTGISELETALVDHFGNTFPGKAVFDYWNSGSMSLSEKDQAVAEIIEKYLRNGHFAPHKFCLAGLRFFEWINQSRFIGSLMSVLANWLRLGWGRILERERFQLFNPRITVPVVAECLEISRNNRSFVAELLLVTSDAAGVQLSSTYRNYFLKFLDSESSELA